MPSYPVLIIVPAVLLNKVFKTFDGCGLGGTGLETSRELNCGA